MYRYPRNTSGKFNNFLTIFDFVVILKDFTKCITSLYLLDY